MAPGFTSPGLFFIGTVVPKEMWFLKRVFEGARGAGYTTFVEPASGAFAMSGLARQVGWTQEQLDASDVSLLSAVIGYAAMGRRLDELEIAVTEPAVQDLDMGDPAHVLYAQMVCRYQVKAEKTFYWREIVTDLLARREAVLADLQRQLSRARETLYGFRYRPLCMFQHLAEVLDNPQAFVSLNPPTHAGGWERFYNTGGRLTWKEPAYAFFDPAKDMAKIAEMVRDAKALVLLYEEVVYGQSVLPPVFARGAAMKAKTDVGAVRSMNTYLSANRPDEIEALANGRKIARKDAKGLQPSAFPILPSDYAPNAASRVALVKLEEPQSSYYRQLWTHRFLGSSTAMNGLGLLLDGYLCGVFAYDRQWLDRGEFGRVQRESRLMLQYGSTPKLAGWRLNRLLTKVALSLDTMRQVLDDLAMVKVTHLCTAQFSKHPESKEMRGLMKLAARKEIRNKFGLDKGFMLRYQAPVESTTIQEAFQWWLKEELRYRSLKSPSTSSPTSAAGS